MTIKTIDGIKYVVTPLSKVGRPRSGREPKQHVSIRLEQRYIDLIRSMYPTLQSWIDEKIYQDFCLKLKK